MRINRPRCLALAVLGALFAVGAVRAATSEFELYWMKTRFEHEIAFRAAAIQVAWGAEALCDDTTEIEPFVLWSANAVPKRLSAGEQAALWQSTGMDDKWRLAWLDEGAPDELKPGMVVIAVNDRRLPQQSARLDMTAIFRGSSPLSADDGGFWDVMLKARAEALVNKPMVLTLRHLLSRQRTRNRPSRSGRQRGADVNGGQSADHCLARFGGAAVAGEQHAERVISVDGLPGSADLFANEVVLAMGGDPEGGLKLSERMCERGAGLTN